MNYANHEKCEQTLSDGFTLIDFCSETCLPRKVLSNMLEHIADFMGRDEVAEKIGEHYYG